VHLLEQQSLSRWEQEDLSTLKSDLTKEVVQEANISFSFLFTDRVSGPKEGIFGGVGGALASSLEETVRVCADRLISRVDIQTLVTVIAIARCMRRKECL